MGFRGVNTNVIISIFIISSTSANAFSISSKSSSTSSAAPYLREVHIPLDAVPPLLALIIRVGNTHVNHGAARLQPASTDEVRRTARRHHDVSLGHGVGQSVLVVVVVLGLLLLPLIVSLVVAGRGQYRKPVREHRHNTKR